MIHLLRVTEESGRSLALAGAWFFAAALLVVAPPTFAGSYSQTNLVSDIPGLAQYTDPNLINPWGMAYSPTSPFWISNNGTGTATLYNGSGVASNLVVTIPPPAGGNPPSRPTGQVFNGTSGFSGDRFIFATEDGTISGWQSAQPTQALLRVDNSASGAIYKGLATATSGSSDFIYAADFHRGLIDIFDSIYSPVSLGGGFTDPNLPSGYAPFNIQNLGGDLYVSYALQDLAGEDDVPGAGHGFVDVFDANGNFARRAITGGALNSPWGMAIAPSGFGEFGGDLLVGNFGDGRINAFDPVTFAFEGALSDANGDPLQIEGLWGLMFGNGGSGGDPNTLYFTAGISGGGELESHGLFGSIQGATAPVPEPASLALLGIGLFGSALAKRARRR